MLIVQISDIHIVEKGKLTLGIAPMARNLEICIDHINQLTPKPDIVLVTGDISDTGAIEEVEHAASLLRNLQCPFYVIPGNHDDLSSLWSVFGKNACPSRIDQSINYVIEGFDVRLIGMDSTISDAPGGELCQTRLAWLDDRLSEANNQPTIIFMHHPPVKFSVLESDEDGFIGADALGKIVEKYSNIERLICGHIHLPALARWHGTIVSTAPSTGMKLGLDLSMTKESEFFLEAPGYQLHYWTPHQNLITHTVKAGKVNGPYFFEEQ